MPVPDSFVFQPSNLNPARASVPEFVARAPDAPVISVGLGVDPDVCLFPS